MARRFATAGRGLRADLGRGLGMASWGAIVLGAFETVASLWSYPGHVGAVDALATAALCATLIALVWILVAPLCALAIAAPRLVRALTRGDARADLGFLAWRPRPAGPRPGAAWAWALFLGGGVFVVGLQRAAAWAIVHYKEPQRTALVIAVAAAALGAVTLLLIVALRRLAALAAELLYPTFGPWSPLTSWRGAVAGTAALIFGALGALWLADPSARPDLPWRSLLDLYAFGGGATVGAWRAARPRPPARARRARAAALALAAAVLVPWTLISLGAGTAKSVAIVGSPQLLDHLIDGVRRANDFDGDGFASLLGENDCAPFDPKIHPFAEDIPDDGIDQNCDGKDLSLRALAAVPTGPHMPVPPPFDRKDWNVLFITIDATRFDHTTFGGYKDGPKHRDTTPNLARLAAKSANFTFAIAAAPGTMASVPAIITSRFFHNGLALDETNIKPGMPPRLAPENTLVTEIMKRGGYTTGAILTHEYFADWGMNQGVDDLDLDLTKDTDPFKITSNLVTDHILAWIGRHPGQKWFLWAHYLDPHGRYVAHPDDVDWSATEEDKYDSEIFYTDKQIGRLLDELQHVPGGDHTIIMVTSDHGDGFGEHGYINHGNALYQDLLHVPLLVYVPENAPRAIDDEVASGLDLVPTVADLCGIDISDLPIEGRSLVPEIFYGRTQPDRIVFSETNWPKHLRSATSRAWKLIYDLDDNLYELYDLVHDPGEKTNLAPNGGQQFVTMKQAMSDFLDRVVYARNAKFNQIASKISTVLKSQRPTPKFPIHGVTFDGGRIELIGWDPDSPVPVRPGDKLYAHVYFEVHDTPTGRFKLELESWPVNGPFDPAAPVPPDLTSSPLRYTLDGLFSTEQWRKGDFIAERFGVVVPTGWHGDALALGVWLSGDHGKIEPTGATPANDKTVAPLGTVGFTAPPPPPPPGPTQPLGPTIPINPTGPTGPAGAPAPAAPAPTRPAIPPASPAPPTPTLAPHASPGAAPSNAAHPAGANPGRAP